MRLTTPEEVCAVMAAHVLGGAAHGRVLGTVVLHKHQCEAVQRLRDVMARHGGALLADEVGLGKTFVALALVAEMELPVVVAPAALKPMWKRAAERAGVKVRFISMEGLGRGASIPSTGIIVVDEAHHFRNRDTKRYAQLAEACARSPVLLLSATPVQNALDDLRQLLALVLGQRAFTLDRSGLGKLVVRRAAASVALDVALPRVEEPEIVTLPSDLDCLEEICALPASVPPADGEYARAFLTFSLARQWASSHAALVAALTRRAAMARAMEDALACGRLPTRTELALWRFADGAQQLAFPGLAASRELEGAELMEHVRAHHDGVRALIARLKQQPHADRDRAEALLAIARRHPGERIVAFAHFTETICALYRLLAPKARVAMLTHGAGRVAGGPVSRRDILAQFGGTGGVADHARIELLLTTDVLSEGVDMQGASVVVHLDLPWNPARLEQRVGRLRRPNAARETIAVYLFAPPAPADQLLGLERRLRSKLVEAARSVGLTGAILPLVPPQPRSPVEGRERVLREISRWLRPRVHVDGTVAAAVRAAQDGVLACVRSNGELMLVEIRSDRVDTDVSPDVISSVVVSQAATCDAYHLDAVRDRLTAWLQRRVATEMVQLPATGTARSRHRILSRVNAIAGRARRHERTALSAALGAARRAATATMPAGAERVLDELSRAPLSDDAWLRAVGQFGSIHGRPATDQPDEILALLLLVRDE